MKIVRAKHPKSAPLVRPGDKYPKGGAMQAGMDKAMKELQAKKQERPCGTYQKIEHAPKHHKM